MLCRATNIQPRRKMLSSTFCDDFGLIPMRPPAGEDLYDVVDGRYQRASTVLTTNRAFGEWPELFDQPVLPSAAVDRLAHGATQIVMTRDSYRTKGPRRETQPAPTQTTQNRSRRKV